MILNKSNSASIPAPVRAAKRWLVYGPIPNAYPNGKPSKIPYYLDGRPRGKTDTTEDMRSLGSFEDACALVERGSFLGLGFALGIDEFGGHWHGIDLDHIEDHSGLVELAKTLPGYVEHSPSGKGVHAIGYGKRFDPLGSNGSGVEAYSSGRYFTVTGDRIGLGEPTCLAGFVRTVLTPVHRQGRTAATPDVRPASQAFLGARDCEQIADLADALTYIDADPYEDWIRVGQALCPLGEPGRALWIDWSARSAKFNRCDAETKWRTFTADRTGPAAIFAEAQRRGWQNPAGPYWSGVEILPSVMSLTERLRADIGARLAPPTSENYLRYRLLDSAALAAMPPVDWCVRGIFPARGLCAIFGPSASGKSFLAIDLAAAIATGGDWFGHKIESASVVYVALEGEGGFKSRISAWEKSENKSLPSQMRLILQDFRLTEPNDVEDLAKAVLSLGKAPVIFVDTLNRSVPGSDENNSKDMGAILDATKTLQNLTGGLVVLIHHTGKDVTKGLRGHSSLFAAMDGAIEVTRTGDRRCWHVAKSKDGQDGGSHSFRLEVVNLGEEDGEAITSCAIRSEGDGSRSPPRRQPTGDNQRKALDALSPRFDATASDDGIEFEAAVRTVAEVLTCPPSRRTERARAAIISLVERGDLVLIDDRVRRT